MNPFEFRILRPVRLFGVVQFLGRLVAIASGKPAVTADPVSHQHDARTIGHGIAPGVSLRTAAERGC
jgi:hypothetical protein